MMAREPVSTMTASSEGESLFLGALAATLFGSFHKRKRPNRYAAGRRNGMRAYFFAANATMRFIYSAGDGDVSKVGAN
jgi:hypothetical protein